MSNNSDKVWPSLTASDLDLTSDLWSRQMTKAHSEWIGLKSEKKSKYTPGDNAKTRQVIRNSRSPISLNFVSRTIGKSKMTEKSCIKLPVVLRIKITEINWIYAVIFSQKSINVRKMDCHMNYRTHYLTHYHWWIGFWSLLFGIELLHIDKLTIEFIQAKRFFAFSHQFSTFFHTFRELIFV